MIRIDIDTRQFSASMRQVAEQRLPVAAKGALTDAAFAARTELVRETPRVFDRPTPFTMRAWWATPAKGASPSGMHSEVSALPRQSAYLGYQVHGGQRGPGDPGASARSVPVPGRKAKRNQYGSMPRGYLRAAIGRGSAFVARRGGLLGVWQRQDDEGGRPVLLAALKGKARYQPRFPFLSIVERAVAKTLPSAFRRRLAEALK